MTREGRSAGEKGRRWRSRGKGKRKKAKKEELRYDLFPFLLPLSGDIDPIGRFRILRFNAFSSEV
jgi:hypothetical protein